MVLFSDIDGTPAGEVLLTGSLCDQAEYGRAGMRQAVLVSVSQDGSFVNKKGVVGILRRADA